MPDFIMDNPVRCIVAAWLVIISVVSMFICIYDKKISKRNNVKLRIPEKTLFIVLPLLGGGLSMFLTMLGIRHKTKHWQMYVIVPLFTLIWIAGIAALFVFDIH